MKPILFLLLVLTACAGSAMQGEGFTGRTPEPKVSLVEAYAGSLEDGTSFRYLVDRLSETCWLASTYHGYGSVAAHTMAAIDCCKLRRIPELAPGLGFARCADASASVP